MVVPFALFVACHGGVEPDMSRVDLTGLPEDEAREALPADASIRGFVLAEPKRELADPCEGAYSRLLTPVAMAVPAGHVRFRGEDVQRCLTAFLVDSGESFCQGDPGACDAGYELRVRISPHSLRFDGEQTNLGTVAVVPSRPWFNVIAAPDGRMVVVHSVYTGLGYTTLSGAVWTGESWSNRSLGAGSQLDGNVLSLNAEGDPELTWTSRGGPTPDHTGSFKAALVGDEWMVTRL